MTELLRRAMVAIDRDPQLGLFASQRTTIIDETPAPQAPVSFLDPDPEEIYLGQTRLRDHLKAAGVRDAVVVREVLRGLDFSAFEVHYKAGGRPPFAPASMVGIVLYGLMHGVNSLRELERFARLDLGCMWISGGNMPDHSVLGRFIVRHADELAAVLFEQVVQAVLARTRTTATSVAGDGTVIEAMSSRYGILTREAAASRLEQLPADAAVERQRLTTMLTTLQQRRSAHDGRGHNTLNPNEPDASVVRFKGSRGSGVGYAPTVLANDARVVIDAEVGISHELAPMQAMLARQAPLLDEVLLDAGFRSEPLLESMIEQDISVLMPATGGERGRTPPRYFPLEQFVYDAQADVYRCPAGQTLKREARYRNVRRARYASRACFSCPLHDQCTQRKRRVIERTRASELREGLAEVMTQPQARARYVRRQAMVEPVFSHLRGQQRLHRFHRRGLAKVRLEFRMHIMAYNLGRAVAAWIALLSAFIGRRVLYTPLWKRIRAIWRWMVDVQHRSSHHQQLQHASA